MKHSDLQRMEWDEGAYVVLGETHCHPCNVSSAGVGWRGQKATARKHLKLAFLRLGMRAEKGKS